MTLVCPLTHWRRTCPTHAQLEINQDHQGHSNTSTLFCHKTSLVCLAVYVKRYGLLKYDNLTLVQKWHDFLNHDSLTIRLWVWSSVHFDEVCFAKMAHLITKLGHYHHYCGQVEWRFWDETAQFILSKHERIHLQIPMKTKLISKPNCIPLPLSSAQKGGCAGRMRLTMTLSQLYHNKVFERASFQTPNVTHRQIWLQTWSRCASTL
jgi:hypothetical protein